MDVYLARKLWQTLVPSPETVTFNVRQPGASQGTLVAYTIQAKRKKLNQQDLLTHAALLADGGIPWEVWSDWLLNATPSAAPTPKPVDQFVDSTNVVWVVRKVEVKLFQQVNVCWCTRGSNS